MSALVLLLIPRVAPGPRRPPPVTLDDFTGQTYTAQQALTATTIFRDCAFRGCRTTGTSYPAGDGGAVFLSDPFASVGFSGCLFEDCWASEHGGAVYAGWCGSFFMDETSGNNCSAEVFCSFCMASIYWPDAGSIEVRDVVAVSCRCSAGITFGCYCGLYSSGSTTRVESVNLSANYAGQAASALHVFQHFKLSLHFCLFSRNAPASCLFFGDYIMNSDISCVALTNNSCQSYPDDPGLLQVLSIVAMSYCVFQSNTYDYFLGRSIPEVGSITNINCVFDLQSLNKTLYASFSTTDCTYKAQPTSLPECRSRTPMPSRTQTKSPTKSQSPTESKSPSPTRTISRSPSPSRSPLPTYSPIPGVTIGGTAYNLSQPISGDVMEFTIVTYPIVIVFPIILGFEVRVYDEQNFLVATYTESDGSLAIYFSTSQSLRTRLVISSFLETQLDYFAIDWRDWTCSEFFISTFPSETFRASSSATADANFTLGNGQNVCLFQLSSSLITFSANYSTESNYDYLRYRNLSVTNSYSGNGQFSDSLPHLVRFWWSSDVVIVSTSFSIRLTSVGTALPAHRWSCNMTSQYPLVLTDEVSHQTLTPRPTETRSSTVSRTQHPTPTRTPARSSNASHTSSFTFAWNVLTRQRRMFLGFGLFTLVMVCP
jgi:hypothetical protein